MGQDAKAYIWVGYNLERDGEIFELLEEKLPELFDEDGPKYLELEDIEAVEQKYGLTDPPLFFDNDGDHYGFGFEVYHHDWDFGPGDLGPVLSPLGVQAEINLRKLAAAVGLPTDKIGTWIQTDFS